MLSKKWFIKNQETSKSPQISTLPSFNQNYEKEKKMPRSHVIMHTKFVNLWKITLEFLFRFFKQLSVARQPQIRIKLQSIISHSRFLSIANIQVTCNNVKMIGCKSNLHLFLWNARLLELAWQIPNISASTMAWEAEKVEGILVGFSFLLFGWV